MYMPFMASQTQTQTQTQIQIQIQTVSSVSSVATPDSDKRGRHRILAEVKRLEQDSKFLQDELDELAKVENVSSICEQLLQYIETKSDPLLPVTKGPVNLTWDQWFEGPKDPQACRCWIM